MGAMNARTRPAWQGPATVAGAFVVDLLLVLGFVTVGRASHASGDGVAAVVAGVPSTGWPFVIGLLVAWVGGQAWRRPLEWWPTGVAVWVVTTGLGLALRWVTDDGVAVPFVLVTTFVLGVSLVGWRVLRAVVLREWAARQVRGAPAVVEADVDAEVDAELDADEAAD